MRKSIKKQLLQLLITLKEAHDEIRMYLQTEENTKVYHLLADCQECAVSFGGTIEQFDKTQEKIIKDLEEYCEYLFEISVCLDRNDQLNSAEIREKLNQYIETIYHETENNIKVTLKITFMPYKASMWTSLESIWEAAAGDENCEVKVVVIPYYTLDSNGNEAELNYEAALFPDYVPITDYRAYALESERPDMIFIHNPYDGDNNVTRVPEQYYSYNLKQYTERLIYSPYGLMGYYNPSQGAFMCVTNAVHSSDKVLVQSEKVKNIYINHGIERNKILALGSPKIDAVIKGLKEPKTYPPEWKRKLEGRKVFLLNTHLSYFIYWYNYQKKYEKKESLAEWTHENILDNLLNREDCALIWRPHPLLKDTLKSRELYTTLDFIELCERRIQESDNGVLDTKGDYALSFRLSDALITTYSSMISEYMISGKPVYIYERRLNETYCRRSPVSYINNYYKARPGEERKLPKFIDMVLNEEDPLYEKRMSDVHRAFSNLDGTIGENIYQCLKKEFVL